MRLVVDVRTACHPRPSGKGQWTLGFVSELLSRDLPLTLVSDRPLPPLLASRCPVCSVREGFTNEGSDHRAVIFQSNGLWWHLRVARAIRHSRLSYLSTSSFIAPTFIGRRAPVFLVIHDLIAFKDPSHDARAARIERWTLPHAVRNAQHIFTLSASTTKDLCTQFPFVTDHLMSVVGAGPTPGTSTAVARNTSDADAMTVLCTATLCPRKNQLRLIHAYKKLPDDLHARTKLLLVGGRGWNDDEIVAAASSTPGCTWLGYLDDESLSQILADVTVFAYPSLYEGFGIPVLDAMRAGIPVLTSRNGSLAEVAGDACLCVDPLSVSDIAKGLEKLLCDDVTRERLKAAGMDRARHFTWKLVVDRFLETMRRFEGEE